MTINPTTSLFSTTKSFVPRGVLTPKSHESQGNIIRPVPLRSKFFPQSTIKPWYEEDITTATTTPKPFKPWFDDDDKENYQEKNTVDGKCLRCFDKSAFTLEPCTHAYIHPPFFC